MLSQLCGTEDVGFPEIVLSDPRQRGADRFRSSVLAIGAQQTHLVRPAIEVRRSSVRLNRLDAVEHLTSERQVFIAELPRRALGVWLLGITLR